MTYQLYKWPTVYVWDVDTGRKVQEFKGHVNYLRDVDLSPDGRALATASVDRTVRIWDVKTGRELRTLHHDGTVCHVVMSGDGKTLFASWDPKGDFLGEKGILWDVQSGKKIIDFFGIRFRRL